MPPARHSRLSNGPAAKGSQKTLSFSNSKVTKPSTPIGKSSLSSSTIVKDDVSPFVKPEANEELGHVTSDAAVQQQAQIELAKPKTVEELKAEKVTDAQIRKYWKEREAERRTKQVHQEDLSVEERVLRLFDTSSQFGVSYPPLIPFIRMFALPCFLCDV
jgi:DNA polymerase delta subunit 4